MVDGPISHRDPLGGEKRHSKSDHYRLIDTFKLRITYAAKKERKQKRSNLYIANCNEAVPMTDVGRLRGILRLRSGRSQRR